MSVTDDTVDDRIRRARGQLTAKQIATGLALLASLAYALAFLHDPLAHDAMHNFRHAAGIACH